MTQSSLEKATQEWRAALPSETSILENVDTLTDYNETTFLTESNVRYILFPENTDQVSKCLKIANKYDVSVYTVSKGKNYGLGSKLPVENDHVIIDLGRMNKITDFSEKLAYIEVEPGVTFRQVSEFLLDKGSSLMLDSIGSTGEASIIGNTAERGHGVALNADRFNFTCGMEVVLPTGEVINTGFGSLKNSEVTALSKWGLGPSLDGIFTQSSYGVITKLNLWLQPKSDHFQIVLFQIRDDENLSEIIERMRYARLQKLSLSLRIFNDYRMISFSKQYPWDEMNGKTPLDNSVLNLLKEKTGIKGKWIGLGALYSINKEFAQAERNYLSEQLSPFVEKIEFYDKQRATQIKQNGTAEEQDFIDFIYFNSSLQGFTSERALNMCYWRVKKPIPVNKNVHEDGCGVLWYCPAIPNTAEAVRKATEIIESTSEKYALEPNVGFLFIAERALDITGAICYDKTDPAQDKAAKACHDEIIARFEEIGYPPYRLGIQSMQMIENYQPNTQTLLANLKRALDPKNVLNRGRYIKDK
ncbi:FAD-binding oxidoreductase [Fulvivirga sp. RKSG066]|uniref:FAD-binding oxidoreductase n=1 Tax=Fulvivirga aurantia TaxID=2529383 RepID=UPI0012BB6EF5|nr:FAD-binding oxidoreductase [Fulvivirga aurantia]MTI21115.1 FAD-binding oxidoreductase [Fulvivirga aurantia]